MEESFYNNNNVIKLGVYSGKCCNISVTILQCTFQHYQRYNGHIIDVDIDCWKKDRSTLLIKNTSFWSISDVFSVIYVKNIDVYFQEHITFSNIKSDSIIEVHSG